MFGMNFDFEISRVDCIFFHIYECSSTVNIFVLLLAKAEI